MELFLLFYIFEMVAMKKGNRGWRIDGWKIKRQLIMDEVHQ